MGELRLTCKPVTPASSLFLQGIPRGFSNQTWVKVFIRREKILWNSTYALHTSNKKNRYVLWDKEKLWCRSLYASHQSFEL